MKSLLFFGLLLLTSCHDTQDNGRRDSRDNTRLGDTQIYNRTLPSDTPNSQRLDTGRDSLQPAIKP